MKVIRVKYNNLKENRFQINFENQLLVTFDRFVINF